MKSYVRRQMRHNKKPNHVPTEYAYLFNAITDATKELDRIKLRLELAQQQAEEFWLERGD